MNNPASMLDPMGTSTVLIPTDERTMRAQSQLISDVAKGSLNEGVPNVLDAGVRTLEGVWNAVRHPINTAKNMLGEMYQTGVEIRESGVGNVLSNAAGGVKVRFEEDESKFLAQTGTNLLAMGGMGALVKTAAGTVVPVPAPVLRSVVTTNGTVVTVLDIATVAVTVPALSPTLTAAGTLVAEMSHTPGRDHNRKSAPQAKERFQKKKATEREAARKELEDAWKKWNDLTEEKQKLLPELKPEKPLPD